MSRALIWGLCLSVLGTCSCSFYAISGQVDRRSEARVYPTSVITAHAAVRARIESSLDLPEIIVETHVWCAAEKAYIVERFRKESSGEEKKLSESVVRVAAKPIACNLKPVTNRKIRIETQLAVWERMTNNRGAVVIEESMGHGPYRIVIDDYIVAEFSLPVEKP